MIQRTKDGSVLLALSALLLAAPAFAQAPQAAPAAQDKAAEPAKKMADPKPDPKTDKHPAKPEDKSGRHEGAHDKADEKSADPTVAAVQKKDVDEAKVKERFERRKRQQEAEQTRIAGALKGQPMSEALRQELTRHART